ncbi:Facilitated trehalose transporter Tret1 [Chamberlinius hualienensis]
MTSDASECHRFPVWEMADRRRLESTNSRSSSSTAINSSSRIVAPLTVYCLFASMIAGIGSMVAGTIMVYPSPAIPDINEDDNPFYLTKRQQAWFGSLAFLGSFAGMLFAAIVMDRMGRKLLIMSMAVPVVIGWEMIIASNNPTTALIGRTITGFGRGAIVPAVHVYISEIAPASMRGTLLATTALYNDLGILYEYVLGHFIHWNYLALANMAVALVMCFLVCFVPETPRFLVLNGHKDDAESILLKLRDDSECIWKEIQEIEESNKSNEVIFRCERKGSFCAPPLLKPFLICMGIYALREFSGNGCVRTYALSVARQTGMPNTEASTLTIVLGLVGIAGVLVSLVTVDRVGRKALLVVSSAAMALCVTAIGIYFKMQEVRYDYAIQNLYWLAPIGLIVNNFCFALAFDSIPCLLISEIFPTRARAKANCILGCWQSLAAFLATFFFFDMERSDESDFYFSCFVAAFICIIGAIVLFFVVPETKKETLENIQSKFQPPKLDLIDDISSTYI